MTTMGVFCCLQYPYNVQACDGFKCYEPRIPLLENSTLFSSGLASCDFYSRNPRLKTVHVAYARSLDRRRRKTCHLGHGSVSIFRDFKSESVGVPRNSIDNDSASASTDSNHPSQSTKSDNSPLPVEHEVGTRSSGLQSLDSYFSKLKGDTDSSQALVNAVARAILPLAVQHRTILDDGSTGATALRDDRTELHGLKALDAYFEKLRPTKPELEPIEHVVQPATEFNPNLTEEDDLLMKSLMEVKEEYEKHEKSRCFVRDKEPSPTHDLQFQVTSRSEVDLTNWDLKQENTTNSNLINVLVATNIAVYLFGLASPHEAFGMRDSTVPFVYGAKVNDLILEGQWWRFITPMFLHASLLHVGLGSWALLSFGPAVESAYGPLGFAMIYFLGGLFGDMSSFFHTSEWTVGGTGPIYALVGTWVVYLLKNRDIIGKDMADDMIRKVVILSAVNVALCNSLPIDDWTHLGAVLIGTLFGFLASPTMQLNVEVKDASPEKQEDVASYFWFNDSTSPIRLSLIFALCLGIFFILYQLSMSGSNDIYLLHDDDIFS